MAIQPLGTRLLVEPLKEEFKTKSGLVLGDTVAPQSLRVEVKAVGPEADEFKVGDIIFVSQYAPTDCRENPTEKTLTIPKEDVIARVVKE